MNEIQNAITKKFGSDYILISVSKIDDEIYLCIGNKHGLDVLDPYYKWDPKTKELIGFVMDSPGVFLKKYKRGKLS